MNVKRLVFCTLVAVLILSGCAGEKRDERPARQQITALLREIRAGFERRGIKNQFSMYKTFTGKLLDDSADDLSWRDKTGNCRLEWVDYLLRQPLEPLPEAERFTWELHEHARGGVGGLRRFVFSAAEKLDCAPDALAAAGAVKNLFRGIRSTPESAVEDLAGVLLQVGAELETAYADLFTAERLELQQFLYHQSTGGVMYGSHFARSLPTLELGETDAGRELPAHYQDFNAMNRYVCDLLEKIDRNALFRAALLLTGLAEPRLRQALAGFSEYALLTQETAGVEGGIVLDRHTAAGRILIGGTGANRYHLDQLRDVCAVIDLGGDDEYIEGTVGFERPVLLVMDLAGNDVFRGETPGIQGGAILGASMLLSFGGNDIFTAGDIAQGSALGGIGILLNDGGNNSYTGVRRVQGQAVAGLGLLLDRGGNDSYRAALLSQGVGGPHGFGALVDLTGNDHYFAGGLYPGGYPDSPGYGAWSQGVGTGPRGSANGGIGVILDGAGDDIYEYDYFSHGGGYWFAAGFARDFSGNDQRLGATRTQFDGSAREVRRFVRWGLGFACHYGIGIVIDDEGDDLYVANSAALGFSWDIGTGAVLDFDGNDRYQAGGGGHASEAGVALLFDAAGDDVYEVGRLGFANPKITYHPSDKAGGNFAFFIDLGGNDDFGKKRENNSESEIGWPGGFFISR